MIRLPSGYTSTAPGLKKNREEGNKQSDEAIGRSRGGLTTKIHLSTDNKGRILQLVLTGGQMADVKMSLYLIEDTKPDKMIADKAYDADWLLLYLDSEGIEAVIPPKRNRLAQRTVNYKAYKERNVIE